MGKKRKDISFKEARELFLAWADTNKRPNTAKSYRECLLRLDESCAGKRLSEITPFLVGRHKHSRVKGGELVAPNRELAVLKAMFNRCLEWGSTKARIR
jgi:hypothetical protein